MNVLFLTLVEFESLQERNIYTDLLREFVKNGHNVCVISPVERRKRQKTHMIKEKNVMILRLQIGNTQKTNVIEKGISTVMIEPKFKRAIKDFFSQIKFDLILYSTPPITFVGAVKYVKKRDHARTYLLLKDIFPQNAVDVGMMSKRGLKGRLYQYFRYQEKKLYAVSDRIGCMSQANVDYVIYHNPEVNQDKVEVCPNSVEVIDRSVDEKTRIALRKKYRIPLNKKVFIYGGNLGKPQGIPFFIECLKRVRDMENMFFLVVGDGTDFQLLKDYSDNSRQSNLMVMRRMPKWDFDNMVGACDVGMIFLDYRFTIPNFPSRLLSYMQAKIPILAVTDPNTDVGKVIVEGEFGWWCDSSDTKSFLDIITQITDRDIKKMGINAFNYLSDHYTVERVHSTIMNIFTNNRMKK